MSNFISNAFMLPNDLIDEGFMAKMKGAALPCYLFIVRKTRGWNKQADKISLSQFVKASGYNKDTVKKGLNILEEMGVIKQTESDSQINEWVITDQILSENSTKNEENLDQNHTKNSYDHTKNSPSENLAILKNSTVLGENLVGNYTKNSPHNNNIKTKKTNLSSEHVWAPDQNQLIGKLKFAGRAREVDLILGLPSFEFELSSFNSHFENQVMSDSKKLHKFTSWIIDKFDRYKKSNPDYTINQNPENNHSEQPRPKAKPIQYGQGFNLGANS